MKFFFASIVLALGIVMSSIIVSRTISERTHLAQTLRVVGSAKKEVTADYATLGFSIAASGDSASAAYQGMEKQKPTIVAFLGEQAVAPESIQYAPPYLETMSEYDKNGQPTGKVLRYTYRQRLSFETNKVMLAQKLSLSLPSLIEKGVFIQVETPQFLYSDIAGAKVAAQALAAADAMTRAKEIAEATGSSLGPIRTARMGVLQITPRNSTVVSDYGVNDTSAVEKDVTAVVQAEFQIIP